MQTLQLPKLFSLGNVTRLWLTPGAARVGAVLGADIRHGTTTVCCDVPDRRLMWEIGLEDHDNAYADPKFDRDLTRVVYEGRENWAWNVPGGLFVRELDTGRERSIGNRAFLPTLAADGRFVFAVVMSPSGKPEIRRWSLSAAFDANTGELAPDRGWLIRQPTVRGAVRQMHITLTTLSVSPDGSRIAGGRYNGTLSVWNAKSRKELMTATATKQTKYPRYTVHRLTFSPDGATLAALCERRKLGALGFDVGVWVVASGAKLKGPKEKESVNGIAFSPDGSTLLTARADGTVGVWETATWKLRREYAWSIGELFSVTFAPDGLTCAAGGEKGQIVVWDVDT